MEFFEKLGKKASETFNSAGEKANKIAVETKLKYKINDCKSKIRDLYQEIGKKVYQKYVLDGNLEIKDDITEELTRVSELSNEIEGYEKQILELGDMKQCVKCKNKINKKAKFCPECGAEQPEEVVKEAEIVQDESDLEVEENTETLAQEENTTGDEENVETLAQEENIVNNEENVEQVAEETENVVTEVVNENNNNE